MRYEHVCIEAITHTLPEEIVAKTRQKYVEAYERLTGLEFD